MQLDLFYTEVEMLQEEVKKLKAELGNTRRGLFARHGELAKLMLSMRKEMDDVKTFVGYKEHHTDIVELLDYVTRTG